MIFTEKPKTIRVMFTPFRDGLQSSFGGKVRLNDFLPAMKAASEIGIRHFEFGGGARYQAPYFYLGEDPFEDMKKIRETAMAKMKDAKGEEKRDIMQQMHKDMRALMTEEQLDKLEAARKGKGPKRGGDKDKPEGRGGKRGRKPRGPKGGGKKRPDAE